MFNNTEKIKVTSDYDYDSVNNKKDNFLSLVTGKNTVSNYAKIKDYLQDDNVKDFNLELAKITFADVNMTTPTIDLFYDRDRINNSVITYFESCLKNNIMPTIATLCVFLGCNTKELFKYASDTRCPSSSILSKSITLCHAYLENSVVNGVVDSKVFNLLGKNYFGLSDDTNVNVKAISTNIDVSNSSDTLNAIKEQILLENNE